MWEGLVYPAASFVAGETRLLVQQYQKHLSNELRVSYGAFDHLNKVLHGASGIVARVLGAPATVVINGLDAWDQLESGKRPDRVFVKVGSGVAGSATGLMIAGALGWSGPIAVVFGVGVGIASSELATRGYDSFRSRTAWEILSENRIESYRESGETRVNIN